MKDQIEKMSVVMSDNAKYVWKHEMGNEDYEKLPFTTYNKNDFTAPFASGSAGYDTMIICPCSMGAMGRMGTMGRKA